MILKVKEELMWLSETLPEIEVLIDCSCKGHLAHRFNLLAVSHTFVCKAWYA